VLDAEAIGTLARSVRDGTGRNTKRAPS